MTDEATLAELKRVKRVADQSCSAHARLRDRYSSQATSFDVIVLAASAWVAALALVDPAIAPRLTPPGLLPTLWIGLLGVAVFIMTLIQLRLNLRSKSDAHRRAFEAQWEIKDAAGEAERHPEDNDRISAVHAKVALAAEVGVSIPEKEFLRQKAIHLRKVELSKLLDGRPFTLLPFAYLKMWWRDNFPTHGAK